MICGRGLGGEVKRVAVSCGVKWWAWKRLYTKCGARRQSVRDGGVLGGCKEILYICGKA